MFLSVRREFLHACAFLRSSLKNEASHSLAKYLIWSMGGFQGGRSDKRWANKAWRVQYDKHGKFQNLVLNQGRTQRGGGGGAGVKPPT